MSGEILTLGSLFSGIGGLELGLEMTGRFKTVWQVEKNSYCRKVLAKHWPDVTRYEDVKDVGKENLAAVDVICGGFPCQDISNAGRRAGIIEGNRSGLWYEYVRIIRAIRPRYVIVENVTALLVRGLDVVLGELAESGYGARWDCIPAKAVGAPHQRDRIFVIAYAVGGGNGKGLHLPVRQWRQIATAPNTSRPRPHVAYAHVSRLEGYDDGQGAAVATESLGADSTATPFCYGNDQWTIEPDVGRVANGVPSRVDRLRALGNAVVPQCAQVVGEWLLEIHDELTAEASA